MQYFRAYQAVFDNPKWATNLLFATLCLFVPVVGPMVLLGYLYEGIETMHRQKRDVFSDFDLNRLVPYLMRGLWVFLIGLLVGVVLLPIVGVIGLVSYFILIGIAVAADHPAVFFIGFLFWMIFLLAVQAGLLLVTMPLNLRAGLSQDFMVALSWPFVRDFSVKMWREELLIYLFLAATQIPLTMAGLLLFCVGIYPAMVLVMMAQAHLTYQAYEAYLARGGEPIPLKEETLDVGAADDDR